MTERVRIVFAGGGTGGHLYPGLAIARALVRQDASVEPIFVGAKRGIERDVLPTTGFRHELLDLHPLYRTRVWLNVKTVAGFVTGWRAMTRLVRQNDVRLVVGTGGYAAGLALAWSAFHGVPFVLQEQNSFPGITMRLVSRRAREIYLGFPEAAARLKAHDPSALVDAGNPIEPPPSPLPDKRAARAHWKLPPDDKVLLVFGGSQGSAAMNATVDAWIAAGGPPRGISVLWATGKGTYDRFAHRDGARVRVVPYIAPMSEAYAAADLAVARAGAMGTAEMCAWGIPQVLVPLPTAAADHQTANARTLAAAGAAIMIPQSEFNASQLAVTVDRLISDPAWLDRLAAGARARARPDAAQNIARRILSLLGR